MAFFPSDLAEFVKLPLGLPIDPVQPADYTGLRNEILAIQEELGVNPAGDVPTLAARLGVQFATGGGWKGFEFGTITNSFATAQTITFTGGRFTAAPQVLAINSTGFASAGEPAIFYSGEESETSAQLFAYDRSGGFSSVSATVLWMAYAPAVDGNDTEGAEAVGGGGGIPPAGVDPDAQVVANRPYYFDSSRQRWVSYETVELVWTANATAIVASRYLDNGATLASNGPIPITEEMVVVELAVLNSGTSSSSSSAELRSSGSTITGANVSLTTAGTIASASMNVEIPTSTQLQAYLTRGGSDSIDYPVLRAKLKYVR
jgi:hypothetical protein